jgi:2-polyprenyl-3-methyl-5-hydroxy-6-metoxy-1,4-benzoquinol methylase
MDKARQLWEEYAERDALWSISTYDKFRSSAVDDDRTAEFFRSGSEDIDTVWQVFEKRVGGEFRPDVALDYGCGVGRLLFPIAARSGEAIGVDISSGMLKGAREFAAAMNVDNIRLQTVDEFIADSTAEYDLVHSFIVLQHVEPSMGYRLIEALVSRLRPKGLGMLHVSYRNSSPLLRRIATRIYRDVPGAYRLRAAVGGVSSAYIPMYDYDLERVGQILTDHGCEVFETRQTDHSYLGQMFFFERKT